MRASERDADRSLALTTTRRTRNVMATSIRCDLYTDVTSRILAELEAGAAPWVKPWSATPRQNVPQNAVTNRPYSGCNVIPG